MESIWQKITPTGNIHFSLTSKITLPKLEELKFKQLDYSQPRFKL
jgi:hypothetical protein